MAHSYTPGLTVTDHTVIHRRRMLPLPGTLLVTVGDLVRSDQVVARAELPGKVFPVNLANQLSVAPGEIKDYLIKKEGDVVGKDEILAENKPLIKWFKTEIRSPVAGTIESVSSVTGQVLLREPPRVLQLLAYVNGTIIETIPQQGVVVETTCSLVQGIFGIGGETSGEIVMAVKGPDEALTAGLARSSATSARAASNRPSSRALRPASSALSVMAHWAASFSESSVRRSAALAARSKCCLAVTKLLSRRSAIPARSSAGTCTCDFSC
ncbi:MAG: hypothetical protein AABZ24_06670, partial [Nitrospirota bacterium]